MPKEGYSDYFMAIVPPSPIYEQADELKHYFSKHYQSRSALNSPPHITLHMPFAWKEKKEEDLIAGLNLFSASRNPFSLALSDYGAFSPRVIFINVSENPDLNIFQNELHLFCKTKLNLFNAQYKDLPFHPHLTLAFRDLKKSMFHEAWEEFREKRFAASFIVDRLTLLKHANKLWHPYKEFLLKQ